MVPLGSKSTSVIPSNLNPNLDAANPAQRKIAFFRFVDPFVRLLESGGTASLDAFIFAVDFALDFAYAIFDVFSRIILPPPFNPESSAFVEKVRNFETRAGNLNSRMLDLPLKLDNDLLSKDPHHMMHDLKSLTTMKNEIEKNLDEIQGILSVMKSYKHDPLPIEEDLKRIKKSYRALQDDYQKFFKEKGRMIISRFREVVDSLSPQGIKVKDEVRKQLFENWTTLQGAFPADSRHEELLEDVQFQINALDRTIAPEDLIPLQAPLKLRNSGGTSCYIDSIIQAFAGIKLIFEELIQPLTLEFKDEDDETIRQEKRAEYHKKLMVQNALKEVLSGQPLKQEKNYSLMESLFFFLPKDSPNECLRKAIFKSGLPGEFKQAVIHQQLDAASIAEFLIEQFLPKFKYQIQQYASTVNYPGIEFVSPQAANPPNGILQIPLIKDGEADNEFDKSEQTVEHLIHLYMDKHINHSERRFNPNKRRRVVNKEEASKAPRDKTTVSEFYEWYRFTTMPSIMTMQFKRFLNVQKPDHTAVQEKIDRPVFLPKDGRVDLSKFYDPPKGESKDAIYDIKSIVVHQGSSIGGGHYVTYTKIEGKYFFCNDTDSACYKEITKEEFISVTDAYLVVLEKVS